MKRTPEQMIEARQRGEDKIKEHLLANVGRWLTIKEIVDHFYETGWTPRNCAAWLTHLRREGRPWLRAEQRDTGRFHPLTKKPTIVWHYSISSESVESPFMNALQDL